jgi:DNA polymerase II small subunit/DNA polymerase delta subunit B
MNKREMVKAILNKGVLISPGLLDRLNENTLQSIIMDAKQNGDKNGLVLDSVPVPSAVPTETTGTLPSEHAPNPAQSAQQSAHTVQTKEMPVKAHPGITIKTEAKRQTGQKLSAGDFVQYYNVRYGALKNMLLRKTNAVSINKLDSGQGTSTIIGMVKEKTQKGIILEDPTGQIEVVASQDMLNSMGVAEDDVLAATGSAREAAFFAKGIVLPDVPLTHPMGSMDATLMLSERISNTTQATQKADIICTPDGIVSQGKSTDLTNPAWVEITGQEKIVRLLVYTPEGEATLSDAVEMLKKRHLSPKRSQVRQFVGPDPKDPFLIEQIPDIFWLVSKEKGFKAYKGVTVISCGPESAAIVDLKARTASFARI